MRMGIIFPDSRGFIRCVVMPSFSTGVGGCGTSGFVLSLVCRHSRHWGIFVVLFSRHQKFCDFFYK
jgi:hypothetical protein